CDALLGCAMVLFLLPKRLDKSLSSPVPFGRYRLAQSVRSARRDWIPLMLAMMGYISIRVSGDIFQITLSHFIFSRRFPATGWFAEWRSAPNLDLKLLAF